MEFRIDFDKASKAWRKNKIKKKNGIFIYKYQNNSTRVLRSSLMIKNNNNKKF